MMIPSVDKWLRSEFCRARKAQMDSQKQMDLSGGVKAHYMETDFNEVRCDMCNTLIEDYIIRLVEFGRRVACGDCYERLYKNDPIQWRELNTDGTLGKIQDTQEEQR